jgi:phosphoglucomutase
MSLDRLIAEQAQYWSTAEVFDGATRAEIASLVRSQNDKELTDRFYRDLEFGTGGMRGVIGAGTNRMNLYNVRKATTALAQYVLAQFRGQTDLCVAISHDSRRFSRDFAQAAAEVLAANGIQALITKELRPTPLLSFMVRHYKCKAGICVTASHNPPSYNGYKVYWETGGQLVPPHDDAIVRIYGELKGYEQIKTIPYEQALATGMIREIGEEVDEAYFARAVAWSLRKEGRPGFKVVYTPLHGAGGYMVAEMLRRFGFDDVTVVPEQAKPDGNFPTVKYPNPEEPEALDMARALGERLGADLVLATDPDVDRIGMEIRVGDGYFRPNGNQIACLLNEYVLESLRAQKRMPPHPLVIKTIVTTDLQADIAEEHGVEWEETLTGFKWICERIEAWETGKLGAKKKFVCGGEESYGFLADSFVRDKDAVLACAIAAEMVAYYKARGETVVDRLNKMFERHGVYEESLYTLTLPGKDGAEAISAMMTRLRQDPPRAIDGIPVKVLRDFEKAQELSLEASGFRKTADLTLPRSNVLQFILNDGTKVSVRPSGTEPKIKFYVSVKDPAGKGKRGEALEQIKQGCRARVRRIEELFVAMAR